MTDGAAIGAALAERHETCEADPARSLLNMAESSRTGDWSLRSALVRFAQPEPTRCAAVLELVRRCEAVLYPLARVLEKSTVTADRALDVDRLVAGHDGADTAISDPYPDTRVADLARVMRHDPAIGAEALRTYDSIVGLASEEVTAASLLVPMVELDELAEHLARWADAGPANPPVDLVDATCATVSRQLDTLGVPEETPWPPDRLRRRAAR